MTQHHRSALVAFIFSLVVVQGLTVNIMPVLFGTIARAFEVNLRQQGQLQSVFLAGGMVALLVSGYMTENVGAKRSAMMAVGLIGFGSLWFGLATSYYAVLVGAFVIGAGSYWILSAYSAVITAHFADIRQRMFMWATAAFAGSATVSTALLGYLVDVTPRWNLIFLVFAGAIWVCFGLFFLFFREQLQVIAQPILADKPRDARLAGGSAAWLHRVSAFLGAGIFNRVTFWILGLLVILDTLAASNIVAWTGRFFQVEHHVSDYQVGLMISASSAGVFVGRLLMGAFVSGRFSDRTVLGTCYGGGILMYILILLVPNYLIGVALVFLNGVFIAAQAPTMYSLASAKFGQRAATAIPLVDAVGNLGGFMGPTVVGALAVGYGLHAVLWLIPAIGAVFVAIVFTWEIVDRRRALAEACSPGRPCEIRPEAGDQPV